jgi:hypothetical protein
VVVTRKERHAGEVSPLLAHQGGSGEQEQRIFSSDDQIATESSTGGLELTDGRAGLKHCSDLFEGFLRTISRMESEYLQAATEGHDTASTIAARPKARTLNRIQDEN